MYQLLLGEFLHLWDAQIVDVLLADSCEVVEMMRFGKIAIGPVEPLTFLQLLERICVGIRIMLDHWLDLPQLRALDIWLVTEKDIDLSLPVLVLEVVVKMPLDRCEELESTLCSLLYLLFMC